MEFEKRQGEGAQWTGILFGILEFLSCRLKFFAQKCKADLTLIQCSAIL